MSDRQEAFADRMVDAVSTDVLRKAQFTALMETADYVISQWGHVKIAEGIRDRARALLPAKSTDTWPGRP